MFRHSQESVDLTLVGPMETLSYVEENISLTFHIGLKSELRFVPLTGVMVQQNYPRLN